VAQVYAVAFASALAFVWFDAAEFGALPALVGRDRVMSANSVVYGSSTAMAVIGPSVGGVLAATLGPAYAVAIDAGSYLVSAVLLLSVSRPFQLEATRDEPAGESVLGRTRREIAEGLRFLWRERLVRAMTLAVFGMTVTGGAVLGLLVVYGARALGLARQDARIGLLFTAGAVGSLAATLVLPRIGRRLPAGKVALLALGVNVPALVVLALVRSLGPAIALLVVYQGTYTLGIITGISLRQFVTPDRLQGRVNATGRMVAWGGQPLGAVLGGVLADVTTVRTALLIMTAAVAVSAVVAWFSPLRTSPIKLHGSRVEVDQSA
jgi:Na+/melibiose symporter-like transporter